MKVKNKNKNLSDSRRKTIGLNKQKKILNPFEIHINRQKFQILGRKQKYDQGLPGIARAKSIKKRKETLLQEYKIKDKVNRFVDRRIGETNSAMTAEDKLMARFTAERVRAHNKKAMFNLAEEEVLTHRGQTLSEIEKFDDPRSDDEDEDDEFSEKSGRLDAKFVEDAHFGGGMLKKGEDGHKSRATLIEELIAESKKRKAERQHAKEKTLQLTEKLDADWKDLLPVAFAGNVKETESKPEKESYDILMRELKFEARGIPSDKLKSESEIAKEEKERLEKLEEERLKRMKGIDKTESRVIAHRSADDLDDGFDLKNDTEENVDNMNEENEENEQGTSSSEESEDENGIMDEDDIEDKNDSNSNVKEKDNENSEEVEESEEDDEKSDSEESEDDDNDSLSDLKGEFMSEGSDDSEAELHNSEEHSKYKSKLEAVSNMEDIVASKLIRSKNKLEIHQKENKQHTANKNGNSGCIRSNINVDKFKEELLEKKNLMEEARKELPYTFRVPETYEDLQQMMSEKSAETQSVIIERMIKCNHPSLGKDNKEKLLKVFAFLLQLLNDAEDNDCWKLFDRLSPHLFELTQFSADNSAHCISEVLKEKQADFKALPYSYPSSDTFIFLQLVALLFPTSDARHQITTPAMVFLCQLLFQCKVTSARDVASGLLVTTIVSQHVSLSKRFCPEAINFLRGCLTMALPKEVQMESIPPFRSNNRMLAVQSQNCSKGSEDLRMNCLDLSYESVCDDSFRLRSINTSVQLLNQFAKYYESLSASAVIFKPCLKVLRQLPVSQYPDTVRQNIQTLQSFLDTLVTKKLQYVMLEKKKPKTLKLYEPDIQKVYDGKSYRDLPEEKLEQQKLLHKYKREMKGALREVRRDKAFLAKIKFRNQAKSDEERMQKVKQIYSWGANQEGELRKLKRKKS